MNTPNTIKYVGINTPESCPRPPSISSSFRGQKYTIILHEYTFQYTRSEIRLKYTRNTLTIHRTTGRSACFMQCCVHRLRRRACNFLDSRASDEICITTRIVRVLLAPLCCISPLLMANSRASEETCITTRIVCVFLEHSCCISHLLTVPGQPSYCSRIVDVFLGIFYPLLLPYTIRP